MKKEDLKKLISQIKKYNLTAVFDSSDDFDKWLSRLNIKQLQNFNSLDVKPGEIMFPGYLLINDNLLNCDDYNQRVEAMSKLKNGEGCWNLFERLCSPNFLNSKGYYKDIEMISKAASARYALWIINNDVFINSKYHDEDLKLIIEAKDVGKNGEVRLYCMVAEALATVAKNIDSINSSYHREDMRLIASSGSECLESVGSCSKRGLNNLAINKVSLRDKYHLENMKILAKNPIASDSLYELMTNPDVVAGQYYRAEVQALLNAKSKLKARAMYYYIANPSRKSIMYDAVLRSEFGKCGFDGYVVSLLDLGKTEEGFLNPNYLNNLKLLNEIDDRFVMFVETILSNEALRNSGYQEFDLELLLSVKDVDILMDLCRVMCDPISLLGGYHEEDVALISKVADEEIRTLLVSRATDEDSVNSINHKYDMEYIANLDLNAIDDERRERMFYYLFGVEGISAAEHVDMLGRLYRGEIIEECDAVLDYLNKLEKQLDSGNYNSKYVIGKEERGFTRIRKLLKNKK